jgi:hypothetical protein
MMVGRDFNQQKGDLAIQNGGMMGYNGVNASRCLMIIINGY